jgi:hypothetical protein
MNKWALLERNSMQQNTLVSKKKTKKGQRTWDKLPMVMDSSRGHKISTRNGSVIDSDLTYKFWNMARSSHGVFV